MIGAWTITLILTGSLRKALRFALRALFAYTAFSAVGIKRAPYYFATKTSVSV